MADSSYGYAPGVSLPRAWFPVLEAERARRGFTRLQLVAHFRSAGSAYLCAGYSHSGAIALAMRDSIPGLRDMPAPRVHRRTPREKVGGDAVSIFVPTFVGTELRRAFPGQPLSKVVGDMLVRWAAKRTTQT